MQLAPAGHVIPLPHAELELGGWHWCQSAPIDPCAVRADVPRVCRRPTLGFVPRARGLGEVGVRGLPRGRHQVSGSGVVAREEVGEVSVAV